MHIGLCGALSCTFARGTSSQRIFAGLCKRACPQSRFSRRRGTGIFGSSWLRGRCGEQVVAAFAQRARFGNTLLRPWQVRVPGPDGLRLIFAPPLECHVILHAYRPRDGGVFLKLPRRFAVGCCALVEAGILASSCRRSRRPMPTGQCRPSPRHASSKVPDQRRGIAHAISRRRRVSLKRGGRRY